MPAPLFLVLSMGANGVIYDAVYTSATAGRVGEFTVRIPQTPAGTDFLAIATAATNDAGGLALLVADPVHGASTVDWHKPAPNARLWNWTTPTSAFVSGTDLTIRVANGSYAARVYHNLLYAYLKSYVATGRWGPSLVAWIGPETIWTCGACFVPRPTTVLGLPLSKQMFISGDSLNEGYWSDAVVQHELGHWAMDAFGTSPVEGGPHTIGVPTFPGQAWSEGWATWFSAEMRGNPTYYDKQGGGMFWVNLSTHASNSGHVVPTAGNGLLQRMDENHVSAILWSIARSEATAPQAIVNALQSPRMNGTAFARGYTRHTWTLSGGVYSNIVDTREPKPMLADFLDALACAGGVSRAAIDAATVPATQYPYPSASPLCQ